jgi:GNAT superfamily N-acetyltransferase
MEKSDKADENPVTFVPITKDNVDLVAGIDLTTYPSYMNFWSEQHDILDSFYQKRDAGKFSFLLHGSTWLGFCIAFMIDETESHSHKPALFASDLVVLPGAQKRSYGTAMAVELLRRANEAGIKNIEFIAREKTTYQILMGSTAVDQVLVENGYQLVELGEVVSFPENDPDPLERGHFFSLIKG